MNSNKTVAIFGVFDGIHEGHLDFIKQANSHGDNLIAIVARDSAVLRLKGHLPVHDESSRIQSLLEINDINQAILGDEVDGEYKVLKQLNPDIIYLGYDQQAIFDSISSVVKRGLLPELEFIYGKPHKPEVFKSSILNKSKYKTVFDSRRDNKGKGIKAKNLLKIVSKNRKP